MRRLLPLLALAPALWPQEPTFSAAEPPQRLTLQIGEHALPITMGETFVMPDVAAGQECRLYPYPLRQLILPGAVSFEYPDGANFGASTFVPEFMWWDVLTNGESIALQRRVGSGDAAHHRNLYAEVSVKCGGPDLGTCSILLDGRELRGRQVAGRSDHDFVQEIYSFEHADATWLLVLDSTVGQPRPLRDLLLASFRFR
jgi:hypothetical protein